MIMTYMILIYRIFTLWCRTLRKNATKQCFCHIEHVNEKKIKYPTSHSKYPIKYKIWYIGIFTFEKKEFFYKYLYGMYNDILGFSILKKMIRSILLFLSYMTPNTLYRTIKYPIFHCFYQIWRLMVTSGPLWKKTQKIRY